MYQAIITRYLPATYSRSARVKAIAEAGSITLSWDHSDPAGSTPVRQRRASQPEASFARDGSVKRKTAGAEAPG